jgi:hypothetical protein
VANTLTVARVDARKGVTAPPGNPYPGYRDITQVFVTYDATFKRVMSNDNGPVSRFIYLGRKAGTGPWTILEIGGGP